MTAGKVGTGTLMLTIKNVNFYSSGLKAGSFGAGINDFNVQLSYFPVHSVVYICMVQSTYFFFYLIDVCHCKSVCVSVFG